MYAIYSAPSTNRALALYSCHDLKKTSGDRSDPTSTFTSAPPTTTSHSHTIYTGPSEPQVSTISIRVFSLINKPFYISIKVLSVNFLEVDFLQEISKLTQGKFFIIIYQQLLSNLCSNLSLIHEICSLLYYFETVCNCIRI